MTAAAPHWDVFCRVVDNYGDAGFCWRLARLLVHAQRLDVTLWIDHVDALARIVDDVDPAVAGQRVDGVHVRRFDDAAVDARPGVAVIEAFGCGLPARFLDAMERERPVWVNLEYLSAEAWVDGVHGLPSPQPQRPLTRWFYFPGFTHATGGLLHERGLAALRDACVDEPGTGALDVSLFCYANRGLPALLETWAQGGETLRLQVAEGVATGDFAHWLGRPLPPAPSRVARGALQVSVLALVTQPAYDHRLWRCDLNIVRGEDSFVRAQWARKPMVWHAYRQAERAHRTKIDAFLARYLEDSSANDAASLRAFWHAFDDEDGDGLALAWPSLRAALASLDAHAAHWADRLQALPELSSALVSFVEMRHN